ncbi:MAG: insulinase family protein [Candidatus Latescibacteria bacterium]|nr:insulinase family protein [Candidatus Latescibacterota bacterium]
MRSVYFSLLICLLPLQVLASSPAYQKVADVSLAGSLSLQHYRLANGLQVAIVEDDTRPVVTCQIAYRVGSSHEAPGRQGMAHLVEHLAVVRSFLESFYLLDAPHSNASTSKDGTKYYATVPKAQLDMLIASFAWGMTQFDVSQEAFDLEKEVVLGEWARSANSARRLLYRKLYARMFAGHPYRYDILGHRDTIKTFTLEQATAFHKRYYVPNNACLVIVGDVKGADILPVVVQHFGEIPKDEGFIPDDVDTLESVSVPQDSLQSTSGLHTSVWGVWHIPTDTHPDFYPLYLFDKVLFDGEYSLPRQRLIGSGKVLGVNSYVSYMRDKGLFYYIADLPSGARYDFEAMPQIIQTVVDSLSEEHLLLARSEARKILYRTITSQSRLANMISSGFIRTSDPTYRLKWMQNLDGITVADVKRVAKQYLLDQPPRTFVLYTSSKRPPSRRMWLYMGILWVLMGLGGFWYWRRRVLVIGLFAVLCNISAADAEIPNHKLYYVQDTRVPQTRLSMRYYTGGDLQETLETRGLSVAFLRLINLALHGEDKKEMDRLGAEFWFNISDRYVTIGMTVFSENLDAALKRLKVMMEDLKFSEELLNRERARIIDDFEEYINDHRGTEIFRYHLYKYDRYRREGTRTALENLTAQDLQQFWDQTLHAKVLFFRVTSDLSKSEIARSLRVMTYNRPRDGFSPHPRPKRKEIRGLHALIFPEVHPADFCNLITNGLPRTHEDWFAQTVLVNALNRLLFIRLREQKGWCYSAGVSIREWTSPPILYFGANPRDVYTSKLIPEMFRLIYHCLSEPDFWTQVEKGRERLKRAYHLQLGPQTRLSQQVRYDRDGVPALSLAEYESAIDGVTEEDIRRVFWRLLNHQVKDFLMLFLGDTDRIKDALRRGDIMGRTTVFDIQTLLE